MTLSPYKMAYSGSAIRMPSSPIRLVDMTAMRNDVLRGRERREQVATGSKGGFLRALRTRLRSH